MSMHEKRVDAGHSFGVGMMPRRDLLVATGAMGAAAMGLMVADDVFAKEAPTGDSSASADVDGTAQPTGVSGYVCPGDWLGEKPVIKDSEIVRTIDTDVLIIGAGNAGSCAALSAAQEGVGVVIAEKQTEESFQIWGDDICAFNSQWMIDHGLGPYNTGEMVSEIVKRCGGRVNAEIVRSFVENCGPAFDNLVSVVPETSNAFDRDTDQYTVQVAYDRPDGRPAI